MKETNTYTQRTTKHGTHTDPRTRPHPPQLVISHLLVLVEKFLSTKCCAVMTQVCEFSNLLCVPDYCIMASA